MESRCVVCHACYDAPCQLKLGSIEGIERGASQAKVYDLRLLEAEPTRLFQDATTTREWRAKGFFPVLNERVQEVAANRNAGLIYQMLQLKDKHPLPATKPLSEDFEFALNRSLQCPSPESFKQYANDNPLWGMPYGLPAISKPELATMKQWLDQGATYTARPALDDIYEDQIKKWEIYLNGDSNKQRLASRYIYEHLFLGHLYFSEIGSQNHIKYFNLIRSSTPPGEPANIIATRRPYDDPLVDRVYYRLVEEKEAIVAKTHMPYALNDKRMKFWQELFIERDYEVTDLPGYEVEIAANPFIVFSKIPIVSRYEFMLDEAQYTVMGFIKGPVCRGQVALNVINDHFWVFFMEPELTVNDEIAEFFEKNQNLLELPTTQESTLLPIMNWRRYSKKHAEYVTRRDKLVTKMLGEEINYDLNLLWDGDGFNKNAALTIVRHNDSATVEQGLLGPAPKTAWVVGYGLLERIHYLLVAGYDVFGNVGHQLLSRLYMDFLRMEGETNFLLLLPQVERDLELRYWYRGADEEVMEFMEQGLVTKAEPEINYSAHSANRAKQELFSKLKQKFIKVLPEERNINTIKEPDIGQQITKINSMKGAHLELFPEQSLILLETPSGDQLITMLKNISHYNITSMLSENKNRAYDEDTMMALRGVVGAYPNELYKVKFNDLESFVEQLVSVRRAEDYQRLRSDYGVRRTDKEFWRFSDRMHGVYENSDPINYGLLDYNRLVDF